jgi:hypothetical protein
MPCGNDVQDADKAPDIRNDSAHDYQQTRNPRRVPGPEPTSPRPKWADPRPAAGLSPIGGHHLADHLAVVSRDPQSATAS